MLVIFWCPWAPGGIFYLVVFSNSAHPVMQHYLCDFFPVPTPWGNHGRPWPRPACLFHKAAPERTQPTSCFLNEPHPLFDTHPLFDLLPLFHNAPVFHCAPLFNKAASFNNAALFHKASSEHTQPPPCFFKEPHPLFDTHPLLDLLPLPHNDPVFHSVPLFNKAASFNKAALLHQASGLPPHHQPRAAMARHGRPWFGTIS